MVDIGVFPNLPGLGWSVTKTPTFQTRVQRATSGRELRALDYPFPLWQFQLTYELLRDGNDNRMSPQLGRGINELRTLMGFFMLCQGAFGTFLFTDPTDNAVTGQLLPPAFSSISGPVGFQSAGSGYTVGDIIQPVGGILSAVGGSPAQWTVSTISGSPTGPIGTLTLLSPGSYAVVPGTSNVSMTGGTGSGARLNLPWLTQTQLVRTLGDSSLPGGGFVEPIVAPNTIGNIYFNGIAQNLSLNGWATNYQNGIVTMPNPFSSAQPIIQADFTYYFRCRFVDDSYAFDNFMFQLWQLKKLTFISVRP